MMTTRKLEPDGLGEKSELELENKRLLALGLPTSHEQLRDIRIGWEERSNEHLARAGLEMRIDRSSGSAVWPASGWSGGRAMVFLVRAGCGRWGEPDRSNWP